jgi:hypothetical protein
MCSATFQRGRWTILRLIIISIGAFAIFFILFAVIAYIRMVPKRAVMGPFVTPANAAQWRGDLRYLAAQIPARHKNAFHSITRASFDDLAANLESKIPSLNADEIVVGFMALAASIGDGHTRIAVPSNFHAYPLELYWFGDTLRVTKVSPEYRRALGAKVLEIGNVQTENAYRAVMSLIPKGENEMWLRRVSPSLLVSAEILHGLRLTPTAGAARYDFEDNGGNHFYVDFESQELSQAENEQNWLSAESKRPLYRRHPTEPVWFDYLQDEEALYLQYNVAPTYWQLHRFTGSVLDVLDHKSVKTLIIDLRLNRGGDLTKFKWILLPELIKRRFHQQCFACPQEINAPPKLYVAIGRETYSAGLVNAVELKDQASAFLVGEPTGARPNQYGEDRSFMLPTSHLVGFVSTRYYRLAQMDTPALMPDQTIKTTWAEFTAGEDPVLDWIIADSKDP